MTVNTLKSCDSRPIAFVTGEARFSMVHALNFDELTSSTSVGSAYHTQLQISGFKIGSCRLGEQEKKNNAHGKIGNTGECLCCLK